MQALFVACYNLCRICKSWIAARSASKGFSGQRTTPLLALRAPIRSYRKGGVMMADSLPSWRAFS
jgi:hypothetical protein